MDLDKFTHLLKDVSEKSMDIGDPKTAWEKFDKAYPTQVWHNTSYIKGILSGVAISAIIVIGAFYFQENKLSDNKSKPSTPRNQTLGTKEMATSTSSLEIESTESISKKYKNVENKNAIPKINNYNSQVPNARPNAISNILTANTRNSKFPTKKRNKNIDVFNTNTIKNKHYTEWSPINPIDNLQPVETYDQEISTDKTTTEKVNSNYKIQLLPVMSITSLNYPQKAWNTMVTQRIIPLTNTNTYKISAELSAVVQTTPEIRHYNALGALGVSKGRWMVNLGITSLRNHNHDLKAPKEWSNHGPKIGHGGPNGRPYQKVSYSQMKTIIPLEASYQFMHFRSLNFLGGLGLWIHHNSFNNIQWTLQDPNEKPLESSNFNTPIRALPSIHLGVNYQITTNWSMITRLTIHDNHGSLGNMLRLGISRKLI
jgi:hypothetical protein